MAISNTQENAEPVKLNQDPAGNWEHWESRSRFKELNSPQHGKSITSKQQMEVT